MLSTYEIEHILESDEFTPREKELLIFVATFIHHVVTHHSRKCEEFIELFSLCAKSELLKELEQLINEYHRP